MSNYENTMAEVTIYLDPESIRDHCGARGISLDGLTDEQIKQAGLMAADTFESDARVWEAYHDALVQSLDGVRPARERLTFRLASEVAAEGATAPGYTYSKEPPVNPRRYQTGPTGRRRSR